MASISVLPIAGQPAVKGSSSKQDANNVDGQNAAAQFAGILGGWIAQMMTGEESEKNGQSSTQDSSPAIVDSTNASLPAPALQKLWAGLLDIMQQNQDGDLTAGKELNPNAKLLAFQGDVSGSAVPDQYAEIEKLLQELSGEIKNIPVFSGDTQGTHIAQTSQMLLVPQSTEASQAFPIKNLSLATKLAQLTQNAQSDQTARIIQTPGANETLQNLQTTEPPQMPEVNYLPQMFGAFSIQSSEKKGDASPLETGRETSAREAEIRASVAFPPENILGDGKTTKKSEVNPGQSAILTETQKSGNLKAFASSVTQTNSEENPTDFMGNAQKLFNTSKQPYESAQASNDVIVSSAGKGLGIQLSGIQSTATALSTPVNPQTISDGLNYTPDGKGNSPGPDLNAGTSGMQLIAGTPQGSQAGDKNDKGKGAGSNDQSGGRESSQVGWADKRETDPSPFSINDSIPGVNKGNSPQPLPLKGLSMSQPIWQQAAASMHAYLQEKKPEVRALEIQLHPAELGKIQVNLHWEGDQVHLQVQASEATTGRILHSHLHDLRQALEQAGVNCGSMQMGFGGEQRRTPWQSGFANQGLSRENSEVTETQEQVQESYRSQVQIGEQLLNVTA